jgi:long-chain acyl-CoA synthetase
VTLLHDLFERSARTYPSKTALVFDGTPFSYAQVAESATRLASVLQRRGVRRGDRVAIFLNNGPEAVSAIYATLKIGAVFMPINPLTKVDKLAYMLNDARPVALVTDTALRTAWQPAIQQSLSIATCIVSGAGWPLPDDERFLCYVDAVRHTATYIDPGTIDQDLAAIIYTSGTTGDAKGVMLSHLNMVSAATSVESYLGYRDRDVILCALPLAFGYGLYQVLIGFMVGATVVLERSFAFPVQLLDVLARERVTVLPGLPTLFAFLLSVDNLATFDLRAIRVITSAGAALPEHQINQLRSRFPHASLFVMYGLTECKRVSYLPPDELDRRPTSVGRGMPNQELWLVDEYGTRLPNGHTGELVIRGSHVMRGYWERPEATAERLKPGPYPGEFVLYSGDIFRTDDEGYLYFVARKDDIIKSRGEKVSPREVENAISSLESVYQVAVVGVPDPLLGEAVQAFVVLREGYRCSERDVIRHCLARLESFMAPKHVVFVNALPMTHTGIKHRVAAYVLENFMMGSAPHDLHETDSFIDRHIIDSTGFIELVAFLEHTFDFRITDSEMVPANLDSLHNIAQFVLRKRALVTA